MKKIYLLFVLIIISISTQSCRKDIDDTVFTPPNIPAVVKVVSSIHGTVTDDTGNNVVGATVTFESETVFTDENGVFQFSNKEFNKNGSFISVEKDGYFKGSRRFYPAAGNTSLLDIELITLEIVDKFNSNTKSIVIQDGVSLDFPENAIVYEDGSAFNGNVNVALAYLDPTIANTLDQMPGDLTGVSAENDFVALKSLAMFTVELMDDDGSALQVKDGKLVDVTIPIPEELQSSAPANIPMWHFDEAEGIWKEEGIANLVGDQYKTSLAHFSFWNCDIPLNVVFMKGTILNRGIPIQGVTVVINDLNSNASGYGVTDENGMFCGYIPGDEELIIEVYDQCGNVIYSETIGPFAEDVILEPINLNLLLNYASVTGTVTYCSDDQSEYAYVLVQSASGSNSFPIQEDGTFTGNLSYCNEGDIVTVSAFDPVLGLISGEYNFSISGDLDAGIIELCEDALVEHIIVEYGNVKWNLPFDDNLFVLLQSHPGENTLTGEQEEGTIGYIIKPLLDYQGESPKVFKFIFNLIEGEPIQDASVNPSPGGFIGYGPVLVQLVSQDGVEYIKASGTVPYSSQTGGGMYDESYTEVYFDILLENK